ncbi:hypothetical protein [Streptomyces sp. SID13726]|uniref:hypothetical protein n=1 Tax=Streptomyces sp. SID13726 TaxID=2706058 RepID=UPI0013B66443|nr:hypothetical protein [Streptomyces sp. SID13726]NEB01411.1 hypothetical protein [Streptomyces sp. SID13726]
MAFQKEASGEEATSAGVSGKHPRLPEVAGDATTRQLCLAVHLNREFCDRVCADALPSGLKAGCPSSGVDMVAVWRHACLARDRRRSAAHSLDAVRGWLWSSAAVLVWGVAAALWLSPAWLWSCAVAVTVAAAALAHGYRVVHALVRDTVGTAERLRRTDVAPRASVPERDAAEEARVERIQRADLIVFSARSATPFIGSGIPVEHVVMQPVDISRGASEDVEPLPFEAHQVHDRLVKELPSRGLDEAAATVRQRLFIRGDVIARTTDSPWEDREKPPPTEVSREWLTAGVDRPSGTARTYVCLERLFNGGRLVVSMYVRVTRQGDMLSLDIATFVLPGLDTLRLRLDHPFGEHFDNHLDPLPGRTTAPACREIAWELLTRYLTRSSWDRPPQPSGSDADTREEDARKPEPDRTVTGGDTEADKWQTEEIQRSAALGERIYDFGAETSLREYAARSYLTDYFEALDTRDCLQRMQRSVIDCLDAFLTERRIDTSEFRTRRDQIINKTTYEIGHVEGTGHHIGPQGKVSNDQSGRPQHNRPTGPGAEQPPASTG